MKNWFEKHYIISLLLVSMVITVTFFGWTLLKGNFFSDDFTWLWHGQKISSFSDIIHFKMGTFYSPVMNLFFAFTWRLFSYVAWPYFMLNLMLHILVATVAGLLASKLFQKKTIGLLSAILISLAGGAYEPIIWVGANLHIIAALFILVGLYFYLEFFKNKKWIYLILSLSFFILSLLTKEIAIVGIALLILIFFYQNQLRKCLQDFYLKLYWVSVFLIYSVYAVQQYLWQKQSYWLSSGTWDLDLKYLAKLPLAIFDVLFPYQWIVVFLNYNLALSIVVILIISLFFIAIKYKSKVYLFVLSWMTISFLPTIFFKSVYWWEPLASRYTYLPRIGLCFGLAVLLYYFYQEKKKYLLSLVVLILIYSQFFAVKSMLREYPFVYQTGESLVSVLEQAKDARSNRICFLSGRPFESNISYIVGVSQIVANLSENDIIFAGDILECGDSFIIKWSYEEEKFTKDE